MDIYYYLTNGVYEIHDEQLELFADADSYELLEDVVAITLEHAGITEEFTLIEIEED